VIGWTVALVEHAEHDVDREDRRRDQGNGVDESDDWNALRRALEAAVQRDRSLEVGLQALDRLDPPGRGATLGAKLKERVTAGELAPGG